MTTIRLRCTRVIHPFVFAAAAALLLPCSAFALNNLDAPPTSAVYWNQNSSGLIIPQAVGPAETADRLGSAVASGDFNGDGFDDLVMGVPGEDVFSVQNRPDAGAITVLFGGFDGLGTQGSITLFQTQEFAQLGDALAAGDIDGDGYDDLVSGMPLWDDGAAGDAGLVQISFGSPAGLGSFTFSIDQDSPEIDNNSEVNDRFGASLSVGDVNADGFADVAVGTPGESFGGSGLNSGAVYLLYGGDDGLQGPNAPHEYQVFVESDANLAYESVAGNQYGYAVLLHDMNGDGDDELVVGAPFSDVQDTESGLVYIHPSDGTQINTVGTFYQQPSAFEDGLFADHFFFGSSLSGGNRAVSGATRSLLIGAPGYNEGVEFDVFIGRAYLWLPGNPKFAYFAQSQQAPESPEPNDEYGRAVLFADLNNDGLADERVIGAPGEDNASGMVQLQAPQVGPTLIVALREGDPGVGGVAEIDDHFGEVLARGNFNGRDGDELVIGIPEETFSSVAQAGTVLVLSWDPVIVDLIFADDFELIVR